MMLPEKTLWHIDEVPEGNLLHTQAVALPCRECKRVLLLTQGDSRVLGPLRVGQNPLDTLYLEYILGCEAPNCEFRAPLYAHWFPATSEAERKADVATWVTDGLTCPQGHAILPIEFETQ